MLLHENMGPMVSANKENQVCNKVVKDVKNIWLNAGLTNVRDDASIYNKVSILNKEMKDFKNKNLKLVQKKD